MCAVSLPVRPEPLEQYKSPERIFRQLRMRRIKPFSHNETLLSSQPGESNEIRDDHCLTITYDKAMALVHIGYREQNDGEQGIVPIFTALGQRNIPFNMVSVQPGRLSLTVGENWLQPVSECLAPLELYPEVFADCVKISVRENGGRPLVATITTLTEILAALDIPVLRLSESYGLIEVLTEGRYLGQLRQAIEKTFIVKR